METILAAHTGNLSRFECHGYPRVRNQWILLLVKSLVFTCKTVNSEIRLKIDDMQHWDP